MTIANRYTSALSIAVALAIVAFIGAFGAVITFGPTQWRVVLAIGTFANLLFVFFRYRRAQARTG